MPRALSIRTPLRHVREITGMNQPDFARRLGVSVDTLKSYEMGRLPVSEESAFKAMLVFGVTDSSVQPRKGVPKDILDNPYTGESFRAWTVDRNDDATTRDLIKRLARSIDIFLRAAAKKGRALPIFAEVSRALAQAEKKFNLRPHLEALAKEKATVEKLRLSRAELRRLANKRRLLGIILRDLPRSISTKTKIEIELRRCHLPRNLLNMTFEAESSPEGNSIRLRPPCLAVEISWRVSETEGWRRRWVVESQRLPGRTPMRPDSVAVAHIRSN